jgi:hypothetical protein
MSKNKMTEGKTEKDDFNKLTIDVQNVLSDFVYQNKKKEMEIKTDEGRIKFCFETPSMFSMNVLELYGENTTSDFFKSLLKKIK